MEKLIWQDNEFKGVNVKLMHESSEKKEIKITLESSSEMKKHQAPGDIAVQVLKGEIDFGINDKIIKLNELDMICVEANIPHSLLAVKDSIVRLTLSKNDSVSRVFSVLK